IRWRSLSRLRASRRRDTTRPPSRTIAARYHPRLRGADRQRTGRGPREGHRTPRSETRKPVRDVGRQDQDHRFRCCQAPACRRRPSATSRRKSRSGGSQDPLRRRARYGGIHVPGAAVWTGLALRSGVTAQVSFQQLTFRKGTTWTARFAPDGETVVYSAAWDGKPTQSYTTIPGHPESRPLDLSPARVFAVSRAGELALALDEPTDLPDYMRGGTLARASLVGVPRR